MNDANKKLLDLAEKATPRPWHKGHGTLIYDDSGREVATAYLDTLGDNTTYIVAAANAVPRLIAEKEALRTAIADAIDELMHARSYEPDAPCKAHIISARNILLDALAAAKEGTNG